MQPIECQRAGRVATLTLNRPPLNVLDVEALTALRAAITAIAGTTGGAAVSGVSPGVATDAIEPGAELAVVFVRGAGERAFSAGTAVQDHAPEKAPAMLAAMHAVVRGLRALPPITVAAVSGHCLGGGMEIAMACDLVIATEDSRFGQPEIDLGCFPPAAAALYPARLGHGRTLALLALGEQLTAEQAERLGLVQRVLPAGGLEDGCQEIAAKLGSRSAPVLRLLKRAVAAGGELPFAAALAENESLYLDQLLRLADTREGIAAFLEKRRPEWKHR